MEQKIKDNLRIIFGIILMIILTILTASIIKDLLILIFKDALNKIVFEVIHFILIYTLILLSFKTKPVKFLEKEIINKFQRKR